MDNLGAHGRGDQRNVWIIGPNGLEEITPFEDTERAARELARGLGCRFYFRRSAQGDGFGWAAYSADVGRSDSINQKWFPTREAAVMYAAMKWGG